MKPEKFFRALGIGVLAGLIGLARAGHYELDTSYGDGGYSGGQCIVTGSDDVAWAVSYTTSEAMRSVKATTGIRNGERFTITEGSAECSGALTAKFVWLPDYPNEPPPAKVILEQTASAEWLGGSGSSDNALALPKTLVPVTGLAPARSIRWSRVPAHPIPFPR